MKLESKERSAPRRPAGTRQRPPTGPAAMAPRRRRRIGWAALVVALVLIVGAGGWLYARIWGPPPGQFVPSLGNAHLATADSPHEPYNSDPPTSGPHLGYIAPWGIHSRPVPKELQLHNLEDGGVAVNYRPDCEGQVLASLTAIVNRYTERVILAPYPGLDRCIALTAWTRIDKLEQVDERRIVRFIEAYRGIDHHPR